MGEPSIERRSIGGRWQTVEREENGGGGGSQTVKWVDLGTIDWVEVFANGPTTLYELGAGEALASIRYLDDVYEELDTVPITGFAGIGTTRSFSWWSFAPTSTNFAGMTLNPPLPPLDTLGLFTRNYHDYLNVVTSQTKLQDGADGPLGISYGPNLAATDFSNYGRAQVLSAVGDVQAAFAFQNGALYSYRLAGIEAWAAGTAFGISTDPGGAIDMAPVKAACIGNGTVWVNYEFVGQAGTTGSSEPDFAGNVGGQVSDGADIVWSDTQAAPPTTGRVHAVAEFVTVA